MISVLKNALQRRKSALEKCHVRTLWIPTGLLAPFRRHLVVHCIINAAVELRGASFPRCDASGMDMGLRKDDGTDRARPDENLCQQDQRSSPPPSQTASSL